MENESRRLHLIETEELAERITAGDDTLRVVDMRGYVRTQTTGEGIQTATYTGAPEEYAQGHIPGAVYLDWTRDVVDLEDPIPTQVAGTQKIAEVLGKAGIGDAHDIVVYDAHPASQFATRFWWVMRYYGNTKVRVLNGGLPEWKREGRPLTTELPTYPVAHFTPHPQQEWRTDVDGVQAMLGDTDTVLLDARDEDQYTGRTRRGLKGGHIPGAVHLPREAFFTTEGLFRPETELSEIVAKGSVVPEKHIVAYCNGGVAATSVLFTLSMLGFPRLTNYDGSWNEWGQREDLPAER